MLGSSITGAFARLALTQSTTKHGVGIQKFSTLTSGQSSDRPISSQDPLRLRCPSDASWSTSTLDIDRKAPTVNVIQVRFRQYKTFALRFSGHVDVYNKIDGKRNPLPEAEERFRRLDWGAYVRTTVGKDNKRWKRDELSKWKREQHIFASAFHAEKFERMFGPDTKRPRYFPDDPWERYNRTSWWRHRAIISKNMENIKRFGNNIHLWDRFKSHLKLKSKYNVLPKMLYMPPGYLKNVHSNPSRVYTEDRSIPEQEQAPHFQRERLRDLRLKRDPRLDMIKDLEQYSGELPVWSLILHPRKFPN